MKKWFFNILYRFRPPESVRYWRKKEGALAKIGHSKDGSFQMMVQGEKYPIPGFPRGHILFGELGKLKHQIKMTFNEARGHIQKTMDDNKYNILDSERLVPAVRELWRAFGELEDAEVTDDMKSRIRLYRDVICYWFQEDDAFRFRFQWLMERLNIKKVRLTKQDKYYFRGKYFKVDWDKYDY